MYGIGTSYADIARQVEEMYGVSVSTATPYGAKTQLAPRSHQIQDIEHVSFIVPSLYSALRCNVSMPT
jgi:hypothetical protein